MAASFQQIDYQGNPIYTTRDRGVWSLAVAQGDNPYRNGCLLYTSWSEVWVSSSTSWSVPSEERANQRKASSEPSLSLLLLSLLHISTVIVGEGPRGRSKEWVASNAALENPTIAPLIDVYKRQVCKMACLSDFMYHIYSFVWNTYIRKVLQVLVLCHMLACYYICIAN